MRSFFLLLLTIAFNHSEIYSQVTKSEMESFMRIPLQYTVLKTTEKIQINQNVIKIYSTCTVNN